MDLKFAKQIGYHFQNHAPRPDPKAHLPWAFAHALTPFPEPLEKAALHLVENELEAYWLAEGEDTAMVLRVQGKISANDENPSLPLTETNVDSRPLLPDQWTTAVRAASGQGQRRGGYRNEWKFIHADGFSVTVNSEREWDGDDEWIPDDRERFARLFAQRLGWASPPS